jgi:glycerol uptake facilitator-like aquaporin
LGAISDHKIEILAMAILVAMGCSRFAGCTWQRGRNLGLSMRLLARFLLSCFLAGLLPSLASAELSVGTIAPAISTKAALGGKELTFTLAEALKKGPVVVYFYPKSFTSVCTEEAHLFAEAMPEFKKLGSSVISILRRYN